MRDSKSQCYFVKNEDLSMINTVDWKANSLKFLGFSENKMKHC